MRNVVARLALRVAAVALGAFAFYRYAWLPEHADHVLKIVQTRTQAALAARGDRGVFAARENVEQLQRIAPVCQLSVAYHLDYAVNDRILGRTAEAVDHYTAALAADHRPEIYFDRGMTLLEAGNLDAATPDLALATRFNEYYADELDAATRDRITAFNNSVPYNPPPR